MKIKELAKLIRNNNAPDCFYYKNKYYVMDYYDLEGLEMNYGSKQAKKDITICTPHNRYEKNFKNMTIEIQDKYSYRLDVNYRKD